VTSQRDKSYDERVEDVRRAARRVMFWARVVQVFAIALLALVIVAAVVQVTR
jgi:hypothetical protein